ncbi:MAG: alpha-maltose-phosphate synthase [Solirubrobacteraceae bacterium]|nr:alpha-maltose-phosphate synthase [Solirubrobacteraceae bacterium]
MKLVGLAQGDPYSVRTVSGAPKFLLDALGRRYEMVDRRSVELSAWQRRVILARTFRPSRTRWRSSFHWHRELAVEARSRNAAAQLAAIGEPFDLVVQMFGLFHTRTAPYVVFTDNTVAISRRCWPEWVDIEGADLERLLEWETRIYAEARHVFTQAQYAASSIVADYGVAPERVTAVGTGANFEPLPVLVAREREPAVLFVAKYWELKGADVLLAAFRRVREQMPTARLWMVGRYEGPADEPGVEVKGFVYDRDELADLYARASVYCLPSRFESSGNSIVEAMAFGVPCVASDVGGLPDVVDEGHTGFLVPPGEPEPLAAALLRLLSDPELATRLGAEGRRRVETSGTWDAVAGRMAPHLERAAAGL